MSAEYRPDRRADKVPKINRVTKNEAAENTDMNRLERIVREREHLADERKKTGRSFSALLKKK